MNTDDDLARDFDNIIRHHMAHVEGDGTKQHVDIRSVDQGLPGLAHLQHTRTEVLVQSKRDEMATTRDRSLGSPQASRRDEATFLLEHVGMPRLK